MSKIKKIMMGVVAMIMGLSMALFTMQPVSAKEKCPEGTQRANTEVDSLAECTIKEDNTLMSTVQTIINVVLTVLGIVAVAMIILGGFNYMTSAGDTNKVTKAKNTIMYGVIGLIIALLAFAIVNFVLTSVFSGATPST